MEKILAVIMRKEIQTRISVLMKVILLHILYSCIFNFILRSVWLIQNNCKMFVFIFQFTFLFCLVDLNHWIKFLSQSSANIFTSLCFHCRDEKNWNVSMLSKMILMNKVLAGHVNDACVCLWLIWLMTDSERVLSPKKASVFVIFFSFCCFFNSFFTSNFVT